MTQKLTKTVRNKVYRFEALSPEAQNNAINYLQDINVPDNWWESVYEDAKTIGPLMGINIETILFTGFYSQGDGACFEGNYSYSANAYALVEAYAPNDETLHAIAMQLEELQTRTGNSLSASISQSGYYYHEKSTNIEIDISHSTTDEEYITIEDELSETLREFMKWIYNKLEESYEYLTSSEAIIETIETNDYWFTKDGKLTNV